MHQHADGYDGIPLVLRWTYGREPNDFVDYIYSYLAYHARRERQATSYLKRIYEVSQIVCQDHGGGDVGENAIMDCVLSLLHLAASHCLWSLFHVPDNREPLGDVKDDVAIAAVFLGRTAYIKGLKAQGVTVVWSPGRSIFRSCVFGEAFEAAVLGGDMDMVKLLLSTQAEQGAEDSSREYSLKHILHSAARYGQRDIFHFALDNITIPRLPETAKECYGNQYVSTLEQALLTPWPDNYERVASMLGSRSRRYDPLRDGSPGAWLTRAASGRIELVRYFLGKGVDPNGSAQMISLQRKADVRPKYRFRPLFRAINKRREEIVKLLLEAGADPTVHHPVGQLLRLAAMKRSVIIAKMLLERGLDPNEGQPPAIVAAVFKEDLPMFNLLREHGARLDTLETGGWALTVARQFGLDSMVDLLIREGVDENMVFEWHGGAKELYHGWHGPKDKSV